MSQESTSTVRMGLIRKKADWSAEAFRKYWLENHGPLVSTLPSLREYRQNHVIDRLQRGIDFARGPWNFDGFSQLRFDSTEEVHRTFAPNELSAALIKDENHFLGGLHIVAARQVEVVQIPPEPGRKRLLKRMSTLRRRKDLTEDDFRREWQVHASLVREMPGVSAYRQNIIIERELVKGEPCAYEDLPIDGIVELWFESPETLETAFASPQGKRTMAHAKEFLSEITAFLVREERIV